MVDGRIGGRKLVVYLPAKRIRRIPPSHSRSPHVGTVDEKTI